MSESNGRAATRDEILGLVDRRIEKVWIPEWENHVYVRSLTAQELDTYNQSNLRWSPGGGGKQVQYQVDLTDSEVKLAVRALCDQEGTRLFQDHEYEILARKNAGAIKRIADAARRLSGITAAAVEELEKNSASVRSGEPS